MFIEEERVEKRRYRRVRFNEPIRYHFNDSNKSGGCVACDLGEGGVRLNLDDFVPLNAEMALQVRLHDSPKVFDLAGRVAWLQQIPYSDRYHVGIEFTKADSPVRDEIRNYIQSRRF